MFDEGGGVDASDVMLDITCYFTIAGDPSSTEEYMPLSTIDPLTSEMQ